MCAQSQLLKQRPRVILEDEYFDASCRLALFNGKYTDAANVKLRLRYQSVGWAQVATFQFFTLEGLLSMWGFPRALQLAKVCVGNPGRERCKLGGLAHPGRGNPHWILRFTRLSLLAHFQVQSGSWDNQCSWKSFWGPKYALWGPKALRGSREKIPQFQPTSHGFGETHAEAALKGDTFD